MNRRPTTLFLVDDHALLREVLGERLDGELDLEVVGSAPDAESALPRVLELRPDVLVLDVDMPGRSSFEVAREVRDAAPDTALLFLSAFSTDRYIEAALAVGASGYATKEETPEVVAEAVRAIAAGRAYFSPKVRARLVIGEEGVHLSEARRSRTSLLTARELEVLRHLARGLQKKEIAKHLDIAVKTVGRHVENLMLKLDIHDRVELARFAIREGLAEA